MTDCSHAHDPRSSACGLCSRRHTAKIRAAAKRRPQSTVPCECGRLAPNGKPVLRNHATRPFGCILCTSGLTPEE